MLDFVRQDAEQTGFPTSRQHRYTIRPNGQGVEILENHHSIGVSGDLTSLTYALLGRIHSRVLEKAGGCLTMHAGFASYRSRSMVFVADKGTGKSTLMTRLLREGFQVYGDELIVIQNQHLFSFPRRFHIKEASVDLLSPLCSNTDEVPHILMGNGTRIFAFSPSEAGFEWRIRNLKADLMIFMHANHRGKSRIEPCPKYQMVQKIMQRTFYMGEPEHRKIEQLCALIDYSKCYDLYLGDLNSAVSLLKNITNF